MNKLTPFTHSFAGVHDAYFSIDHYSDEPDCIIVNYWHKDDDVKLELEKMLSTTVPRLSDALLNLPAEIIITSIEGKLYEFRIQSVANPGDYFIIYNVPIENSVLSEFRNYGKATTRLLFRAVTEHPVDDVLLDYEYVEPSGNGDGFTSINPQVALATASQLNPGILDPRKRKS